MLVSRQKEASRFGQRRPPLTELIRNILERYPDGGQILKELIQNADDAGATEVNFLYDNRCHGTESLETPELANFQGPALYCHNNATFKEEDWEGIQNLMQSNKKDDPLKVGRFGIGFNSVYHITDLPGIVSGTTVGFLDPHETHFIDEDGRVSGKRYFFDENLPDHISRDQFLPFQGIFDCNIGATESYNGTLFRFPLRTVPSKLSKKNYTKEMVDNLFGSLRDESSVILLFLKSVLSISVHERNQDGEMECVFKVEVAEDTRKEVRRKRQEFLSNAKEPTITESRYIMSIQVTSASHAQRFRLLIVNQVGSNEERISELADELCLLPWVGMAVALDENNNASSGRIFCFLPLPSDVDCQTGLPIHVHGYFGLTDNRRGLVWPGADCQNTATAEWNELLLKKIAVEVYCKILEVLVQDVPCTGIGQEQRNQLVYGRLPVLANVQGHWKVVLDPLFRKLTQENHKLFYAQHKPGNSWITLGEGILDRLKESGIASETREVILKILLNSSQIVITNVPPHVLEIVKKYFPPPQVITPALLRSVLKSQDVSTTPREDKVLLLDFVLRDDPTTDLKGVPLLPLANKQFTIFSPHNHAGSPSTSIFVPTSSCPATLLPNMSRRFLDEDLPEAVGKKLVAMATNDVHGNNSTQLVRVTKEIVLENLRSCLPSEWSNSHEKVQWVPGYSDHPPESWLKEIWHWIHSSFSNTLSPFTNVPLVDLPALPTVATHKSLGVLSQHSKFIFAADDSCNVLPIQVTSLLTAAECTVLSDPPSYLRHPDINSYIAAPTPSGATSILCRASLQTVQQHIKLSTSDDRGILREFFSRLPESLCTDKRNFLLQLPLFDTLHGSCTAVQVNGQILNAASPQFCLPSGFNLRKSEQIISSADPKAHQLLTMLNVEILRPAAVFVHYLFPDIQAKCVYNLQETSTIMLWILHQMFNYKSQFEGFHEAMTALPFVSTDKGELKKPSELYDPNDALLLNLFLEEANKFPSQDYADGQVISALKELGLRTRSMLTSGELLGVAVSITTSLCSSSSIRKVQALVEILESNPAHLNQHVGGYTSLKDKLLQLKWLPCAKTPPNSIRFPESMPWFNSVTPFFAPAELRSKSLHALLVGTSMPILDVNMDESLQEELGLTSEPPIHQVVAQLKTAVQVWQQKDQKKATSLFQEMIIAIYRHLSKKSKESVSIAINDASLNQWIWHGTGFCSPTQVALGKDFPLDLRPQLFLLPEELNDRDSLTDFFFQHGVRQRFSEEDIISVLPAVREKHTSSLPEAITTKEIESDLKLCRSILEWLVEDGETLSESLQEKVLVPVQSTKNELILESCKSCTYCDRDWLRRGGSDLDIPGDYQLIHELVPTKTAKLLGVSALSGCLLSAETLDFEFEQTGPHEPLTTRLSNILKEYKEGVGVFKELIQNADDAGASKVRFLVDWRHGPKEKLLSPGMVDCQGPALWAYNNSVFTDKDFENINKLAGATKVEDFAKIGRFGLGFNAVYHLTDVPSFVSREYLVIFDPNVHHLQSHIKDRSRPGIRIDLAKNPRPLTSFEDQFQPYHGIFDCNTQCREGEKFHCDGTLFRFPFRTLGQADKSEICQNVYDKEKVKTIVGSLRESASLLLLYTQHVNEVELYELAEENNPQMMKLVLSAKKNVPQDTYNEGSVHTTPFIKECSDWWRAKLSSADTVPNNPSRSELITIDIKETASDLVANTEQSVKQDTWLVSSCVGTDSSARLALGEGREHGLLPCAGAAAKLLISEDGKNPIPEGITGEAFCFLPLSIATGLPVHINSYFSITSNRRGIWERSASDQCQPIEVQWNESLMEDALSNAYIHLLQQIKPLSSGNSCCFHKLWPRYETLESSTWGTLVKSVYSKLVGESLPLLWSNGKWLDIHSGYILDEDLREAPGAVETLGFIQENVFDLTTEICSTLKKSGHEDTLVSRTLTLKDFFRKFFFPNITKIPLKLRDPIVSFGLDRIFKGQDELIPLFKESAFVSTDEGELKKSSELYDPNDGLLLNLFLGESNKFPTKDFASENVISTLKKLGLQTRGMVAAMELLKVAKTISLSLNSPCSTTKVQALVTVFQDNPAYLNEFVDEDETLKVKLLKLKWLPRAKTPPESCRFPNCMPWFNSDAPFFAPTELCIKSQALLVGASMPTLDIEMDNSLEEELGLTVDPPLHLVIAQLNTIVQVWQQQDQKKVTLKIQDMLTAIYQHLSQMSRESIDNAMNAASLKQWIWHGTGFCSPAQMALEKDFPSDLRPHLFLLPEDLEETGSLTEFFRQHGVREKFTEEDIISVLTAVKDKHASLSPEAITSKEIERDSKLCRSILEWLVEDGETLSESLQEKVLVPVQSSKDKLVLEPCKNCTYCDRDWLRHGGSELDIPGDYQLIHESVPTKTAKLLGVPALSACLLSAETLDFEFEQTGPHEPLTTRLSNILKEYKEGVGVFKELIQNADDAGASKVRFLVDWRHGPKEKLLSPGMVDCQGPALWAYNNSVFTDKDFENINKLAGATKVDDLAKIGRFGLGFNAVYHLTDVPSFVSREYLVIFDPNVHHLQSHIKDRSRPGIRINLAKNPRPLTAFEDQFQPYHGIFDCNTQCREGEKFHCNGTLFRFPFRTLGQADKSEICQNVYNKEKVKTIVGSLRESASLLLLYTQYVNEVELYELADENNPQMMKLVLSAKKSVPQDTYNEGSVHTTPFIKECSDWWRAKLSSADTVPNNPSRSELITIDINERASDLVANTEQSVKQDTWLVSSCVGTDSSARLALGKGREHGLLPCAGAAAKLSKISENEFMDGTRIPEGITGEAFCFLPLSIATGLPVHINSYFSITSNRRGIWERSTSDQCEPIEVQWNESLMEDALSNAYIHLLEQTKPLSSGNSCCFHKLWPRYETLESSTWGTLVKSVYSKLVGESLPLLFSNGKWLDIHSGYILDEDLREAPGAVETLGFLQENVFDLTTEICSTLKKSGHEDTLVSRTLTLKDFFRKFFFPNITKIPLKLRDPIVSFGLDRIFKGQDELIPLFKESAFVSTDEGELKISSELYDPNDVLLLDLFLGESNKFPTKDFGSENVISTLKKLGLQTRGMVTAMELLKVAETISSSPNSPFCTEKVQALVTVLQDNPACLNEIVDEAETLKVKLLRLKWLPCAKTPPESCRFPASMPWFNSDALFFAPTELRSKSQALLIGSSMPILDIEMDKSLQEELDLTAHPPVHCVVAQLNTTVQIWKQQDDNKVTSKFQDMLTAICQHLSKMPKETVADAINAASLKQWIWHGTGFCSPTQIALKKDFPFDLRPHLFLLPEDLEETGSLTEFFLQHGVRQTFSVEDIILVLATVKDKHASSSPQAITSKEIEMDLKICRSILEWLVEDGKTLSESLQEKVLVPVQSTKNKLILELCNNCTYCDQDWLRHGGSELDIPGDYQLIHESVPTKAAKLLGVPALSTCLLSAETLGFEQTGPHEPLTTRLSNILKEYKEGVGVFKELIQNADDAGASKVRFLVDWRHGPKEKLLSPDMEHCQGPALWAYNNSVFTDKDFENINKLAGATKVDDLAKIGRFGLGFNAVYHLTDVPSFVSREYLVIFDPNVHYLQSHIKDRSRPGIRINLAKNPRPLTAFEDQFQPYHGIFDCNTQCREGEKFHCNGTLFRFPFRTLGQANKSEICQNIYDKEKVKTIVGSLRESASLLLLYTQHVNEVELYELAEENNPQMMKLVLSAKKSVPQDTYNEGSVHTTPFIKECSDWWRANLSSADTVPTNPSRSELITIDIKETASDLVANTEQSVKQDTWLVSSCVGTDSSARLALGKGREHGLLPCAAAAAKLSKISEDEFTDGTRIPEGITGEAFCFLPLSIATGLPVHINSYFSITSNRRGIWERSTSDQCEPIEVQWNESLMEDALSNAYIHLLEQTKPLSSGNSCCFHKLWPRYETLESSTWGTLVKSVYSKLVGESLPLLFSNGKWLDIHSGYILDEDLREAPGAVETLGFLQENVFDLTTEICSTLKKSGHEDTLVSRTLTLKDFFRKFFFPNITKIPLKLRDPIGSFGLDRIFKGQDELIPLFKESAFVSTDAGELKKSSELYDPNDVLLLDLFLGESNKFPTKDFASENVISTLKKLGLQTRGMVTAMELLKVAETISSSPNSPFCTEKVQALVTVLQDNPACLNEIVDEDETLKVKLLRLKWLPCAKTPPESCRFPASIPWFNSAALFFAPTELRSKSQALLIGSSMPILNIEMDKSLQEELDLTAHPPVHCVVAQLNTTVQIWKQQDDNKVTSKFQDMLTAIYQHLSKMPKETVADAINAASLKQWIWHGTGFCSPTQIALKKYFPFDLRPHLFLRPQNLEETGLLTEFFLQHGVRQTFSVEDIILVLATVKDKHASSSPQAITSKEIEMDLKICRSILEWLVEDGKTLSESLQGIVLVPVQSTKNKLVLELCNNCTYCDQDWLRHGGSELDIPGDYQLIHESVPTKAAKLLGVPALSTCLLSAETLGFEQTGPHEPLTTRLSNILKEYKEGVGVFKELIQNADDAGASKVRFLVDWRHGPKEKLLSPDMEHCQGPALWAYNNSVFTDKDFENINKLAGATKVDDLAKIGRFGLGFNAVYHLTDVPSFVSREYLVIFDPNVHYLQSHIKDKSRPGIRINLAKNPRPLTAFEDQFQPYHGIFDCNTQCREGEKFHCDGTLFRFPFRTLGQADKSEICQNIYDKEKVKTIVGSLRESASLLLLYTQHVNEVELYELADENNPQMMKLVLSAKKSVPQDTYNEGSVHTTPFIKECSDWWRAKLSSADTVSTSPSRSELITIDIKETVSDLVANTEQCVAQETWLVSSCVGTDSSARLALGEGREHGLLPCAGAAAKLSKVAEDEIMDDKKWFSEGITGEAFCFLPLSIATGLPVHINGYFAITSNRRRIWERSTSDQSQPIEVQWNESLMEDALSNAYIHLLETMKYLFQEQSLQRYYFHELWPCYGILKSSTWETLVKSVYSKLVGESLPLLFSNGKWLDIHSGYILDEDLRKTPGAVETLEFLQENVFDLTEDICSTLKNSGQEDTLQSRTLTLENFLKEFFFPNITELPQELRDPIVCFGLDRIFEHKKLVPFFKENACIRCSDDGVPLAKPCDLIHPEGAAANLFSPEDNRFPVGKELLTSNRLYVLEELGMVKDMLSWEKICERAKSVEKLEVVNYEVGLQRVRNLINYLNKKIEKLPEELPEKDGIETTLRKTKFLPFKSKLPYKSYALPWKGAEFENPVFHSPEDLFLSKDADLVGSCVLIVDDSNESGCGKIDQKVKKLLGFSGRRIHNDHVLLQLDTAIKTWAQLSEEDKKSKKSNIASVCKSIYKHIDDFLGYAVKKEDCEKLKAEIERLKGKLTSKPWLFVDGTFVSSDKVSKEWTGRGAPFLYGLPEEFCDQHKNLLQVTEVKKCFDETDFLNAVSSLRVSKKDSALTDYELSLAVCFLNELRKSDETFLHIHADRLLLPDNNKILSKAAELSITDTPWLTDRGDARYVHKDITANLAFKFGAKSLRDRRLKKYSKTLGTPFGQHEKLTDRLKNILKSYPCDSGILKELVQNADDAKATEIHFIYDTRTLPHKQVFQENADEIQGPALCVYNDRYFSDEDLEGIQKLGIGSKSDDPEKTGQYGVGFNAVYHLTDCPSFLSNDDTLCLLDPHCRYAPGATPEFPGKQFSPVDAEFKEDFSDTLSGYLGDHFELKGCTMFRLPLRNRDRSQSSLISEIDASTEIQKLLEVFRGEAKKSLLFLNHVKKISISKLDKNGEFKREYEVSSIIDEEDESKRHNISLLIKEHKDKPTCDVPWQGVTYPMILSDSYATNEEWLVHQCFGSNLQKTDDADDEVPDGRLYGLLPRGGVAALVSSNRSSETQARHVAYCFLPLPVYTSLPVHVNGHFALDPARRALWKDADETKPLVKWNSFMKSHVLAPGYASLILDARNYMPYCEREPEDKTMLFFSSEVTADCGLHWYHKLFPDLSNTYDAWKTLAVAVYRFLGCTTAPVLPLVIADEVDKEPKKAPRRIRRWLPAQESFFLNKFETPAPPWKVLLQIHLPMLVSSPLTILDGFKKAEITPSLVSPESVINALRDIYSDNSKCNIGNLPSKIEETLIRSTGSLKKLISYCQKKENFASLLIGLPLLLTADGILRDFDANYPVYCSKFSDLFPKRTHQFVHPDLRFNYLSTVISGKEEEMPQVLLQLTASSLATFMPDVFPASMRGATKHLKFPEEGVFSEGVFSEEWLKRLWQFLQHHAKPEQDETEAKPKQDETGSKPTHVSLDLLKEWPIVPTKCKHLVTIGNAKTVLDMTKNETESEGDRKVREYLEKLCCPSLDTDITYQELNVRSSSTGSSSSYSSRYQSTVTGQSVFTTLSSSNTTTDRKKAVTDPYVAHPHSVADVLQVLDYMRETDILDVQKLSKEEIFQILKFVQNGYESLRPKENYNNILKKLPLYKSINKSHYSLSSFSSYAIVPDGVPTQEIEKLQIHTGCLFLHSDALPTLTGLLEGLGAGAQRSVAAFYIGYILHNFSIFSYKSQLEYLTHIRDDVFPRLCEQKEKEDFLYNLKGTACIPTPNGQLRHASEFYDPRNKVFRIMLEENSDQFPPSYFNETKWLKFLTNIGLQSDVNQNVFSKFCDKVASAGNVSPQDETNRRRSNELVRYLLTNHHLHETSFLSAISTVKFIASEKVESNLLSLYKQYQCSDENQHPPFLQFSNSVPWKYRQLVWTSASLLPECDQLRKEIPCESCKETCSESFFARLGIRGPCVDTVVGHLQNICGPLAQTSSKEEALQQPDVLKTIMTSIYKFFQGATECKGKYIPDNCNNKCKTIGYRLKTTPCILVGNNKVVVRGDQLSFKEEEKSLQPFLYSVPREYGSYEHILKRLGATEEITSLQLANVFKTMKDRCRKAQMNPEYKSKASDATFLLFRSVLKESDNGDGKSKISELTELYLPSEDKRLIKSNELLCKVPPRHITTVAKLRYRALLSWGKCGLSRELEDKYLQAIPEHLRPKSFHDIVKEMLDPSCLHRTCRLYRGDENCEFIEKHTRIINSKEFHNGIVRLLKHQKNSSELTKEEKEKSSRLGPDKVEVKCMETIKVHFVLEETNEPMEKSSVEHSCYAVKEIDSWKLYIRHDNSGRNKQSALSKAINRILNWYLTPESLLVVNDMLSCDSPSEIADVLTSHDIQEDFVEEELKLGREVPVVFHYIMQQNPLFVFHEGELVAFGVETREKNEENAVADSVENEDGGNYVLAKIISCVTSSNGDNAYDFKARYLIDLGNEKKEVSVLDLYKFYQNDPDENPITDMVLYTGNLSRKPTNLDEAKREIREALRQAWLLPLEMRRKVIRRLYLRWHPDKNPNNVEFATEMMAFLLSEIKRLKEEEKRLSKNPVHCNFEDDFEKYDDQARRERETYRNYSSCYGGWPGTSSASSSASFSASFSTTSKYTSPNPREASRWLVQSENDLEEAQFLLTAVARPFNALVCFLSQQVVEKSLKAALYAICGLTDAQLHTHDTSSLAQKVSELNRWPYSNLVELAVVVGNYYLPTRYPNRQPSAIVPCNAFSVEQSTRAVQSAKEVLTQVKAFTAPRIHKWYRNFGCGI